MIGSVPRLAWVDAAKGLAIFLVVVHHCVMFLDANGVLPQPWVELNGLLGSFRMPLFFLASGLFLAGPIAARWRVLLHRRVALFVYLYVLWSVIRFVFFSVVPQPVNPDETASWASLAWALVLPATGLWFIYALAVFSVAAKAIRRIPSWLQLGLAALLSVAAEAGLLPIENYAWASMARYLFFFLLGCYAKDWIVGRAKRVTVGALIGSVGAAGVAVAGIVVLDLRAVPGVSLPVSMVVVFCGVLAAAYVARWPLARPVVALGRQTLPVYLIHVMWVAGLASAAAAVSVPRVWLWVAPVVCAIAAVGLSLATHRVLVALRLGWLFELPAALRYRSGDTDEKHTAADQPEEGAGVGGGRQGVRGRLLVAAPQRQR